MDGIGEAIAALVEMTVRLVFALVELTIALVELVLGALGFSVEFLASDPGEERPRFSAARLGVALIPWVFLVVAGGGAWLYGNWRHAVNQRRAADTRQQVEHVADQLAVAAPDDKGFTALPHGYVPPDDAWGNALRVEFKDGVASHILQVSSDGPNQKRGGLDDIVADRRLPKGRLETAGNVAEKLWDVFGPEKDTGKSP